MSKKKSAGIRGKDREKHFEDGGSPQEWRGTHVVQKNKKDKRQNRRTRKNRAIKEGLDE